MRLRWLVFQLGVIAGVVLLAKIVFPEGSSWAWSVWGLVAAISATIALSKLIDLVRYGGERRLR